MIALLVCLLATAGCTAEAGVDEAATSTFDVTDLELLQSTWWTWAASAQEEQNPVTDATGEHCGRDQPDGVWLLAGSFGETLTRRCAVPAGVPLAGPAVNLVGGTQAECDAFMGDAEGKVTLDEDSLPLRKAAGVPITFTAVAGNPVTGTGGEFDGYGCGLWFSVDGLDVGEYDLVIEGGSTDFALSVTYELTVSAAV